MPAQHLVVAPDGQEIPMCPEGDALETGTAEIDPSATLATSARAAVEVYLREERAAAAKAPGRLDEGRWLELTSPTRQRDASDFVESADLELGVDGVAPGRDGDVRSFDQLVPGAPLLSRLWVERFDNGYAVTWSAECTSALYTDFAELRALVDSVYGPEPPDTPVVPDEESSPVEGEEAGE